MTPAKAPPPTPARQAQAELRRQRLQAGALLDTAMLRRLRLQAGYSTRRFARALGVSASTIRGLEEGSNHDQLPLTFVARLSELLGVAPQELFAHRANEPVDPSTDDRIVEAALQSVPGVVAISELARALEWKLERTRRALDALEDRLQPTGTRLHRNGWQQCAIRPATQHLTDAQQQAMHRIGPRDRGLNHITARLLLAATRGELDDRWVTSASNSERVGLQSLLKQRVLLTIPGESEIIPAPEMIYGLDPDLREPPPVGALSPVGRRPEDHPDGDSANAASAASPTEQLSTPD
jgi:transcriptional regulator with XRE-family HTH domain